MPAHVVRAAIVAGVLREGPYGSAWFAHCDNAGSLRGMEMRGPNYRGFSAGGDKTLFRLRGMSGSDGPTVTRLVVAEAPIDAMSFAAIEQLQRGSLYAATAGGMGPETITALEHQLSALSIQEGGELVIATDDDAAGHGYADRLMDMAAAFDVKANRMLPTNGAKDWNDVLKQGRGA